MNTTIVKLTEKADLIAENAKRDFGDLNGDVLNWKPDAKSWSIGQCFEHLIITNNLYFPNVQKVIDGKHRNNFFAKIPLSVDLVAALMKNSLNPTQKRKMKTFKVFEPATSNVSAHIINNFSENNRKLCEMIKAVENLEISKIKIAEPLSPLLNLRLNDAFEILLMHEERHLLQANRVKQTAGFPS